MNKTREQWVSDISNVLKADFEYLETLPDEIRRRTKITIKCPIHGFFQKTAGEILLGKKCPICAKKSRVSTKFKTSKSDKLLKAFEIHSNKYDYSLITDDKIIGYKKYPIICKDHGIFYQVFDEHLRGRGCPKCSISKHRNNIIEDISSAFTLHSGKYDYSKINKLTPIKWKDKHSIICPVHGEFLQIWNNHMKGYGCPKCISNSSKVENILLKKIQELYTGEIIQSYRPAFLDGQEIDIFIPEYNVGIEVNGLYWHSEKFKNRTYHHDKWLKCKNNNVILLSFFSDDLENTEKFKIILSKVSHYLNLDQKIYARKCNVVNINKDLAIIFTKTNHLEGFNIPYKDSKYIGLYNEDELFMVAIYGRFYDQGSSTTKWKLQRVSTKLGFTVVGGISKLSKYIYNDIGDFTFQITLDTGGSLSIFSNDLSSVSLRYWWTNGKIRIQRNKTQKKKLMKNIDWENTDTEVSYLKRRNWNRIFDCGILTIKVENKNV
jgi:hypothetical protein